MSFVSRAIKTQKLIARREMKNIKESAKQSKPQMFFSRHVHTLSV